MIYIKYTKHPAHLLASAMMMVYMCMQSHNNLPANLRHEMIFTNFFYKTFSSEKL